MAFFTEQEWKAASDDIITELTAKLAGAAQEANDNTYEKYKGGYAPYNVDGAIVASLVIALVSTLRVIFHVQNYSKEDLHIFKVEIAQQLAENFAAIEAGIDAKTDGVTLQ